MGETQKEGTNSFGISRTVWTRHCVVLEVCQSQGEYFVYEQRFVTEPMYKDLKSNGFDLERTKVTDAKRIDTFMILCAFAMILLLTLGVNREEHQQSRTTRKKVVQQ